MNRPGIDQSKLVGIAGGRDQQVPIVGRILVCRAIRFSRPVFRRQRDQHVVHAPDVDAAALVDVQQRPDLSGKPLGLRLPARHHVERIVGGGERDQGLGRSTERHGQRLDVLIAQRLSQGVVGYTHLPCSTLLRPALTGRLE
jgi:hypothetical protein